MARPVQIQPLHYYFIFRRAIGLKNRRHEIQCNAMAPLFSQKYMDVAYFNILFNIRNKFVLLDSL